jgi:hypothetical protein
MICDRAIAFNSGFSVSGLSQEAFLARRKICMNARSFALGGTLPLIETSDR